MMKQPMNAPIEKGPLMPLGPNHLDLLMTVNKTGQT